MNDKVILLQKIESTRKKMSDVAQVHPYSSNKVLQLSKDLDHLINKYYSMDIEKQQQT
jgi:hypothetical protein